jgi:hypothetical protein
VSYNLNFHQTFKPESEFISRLLSIEELSATKEELSHRFGIPTGQSSGKVEVSLLYGQAAGLLSFSKESGVYHISRTPLGSKIYEIDSYFENQTTKLLFHFMYCSIRTELVLWRALFVDYRAISPTLDIKEFQDFASRKFKANNVKTAPLIGTYLSEEPLVGLGLLVRIDSNTCSFGNIDILTSAVEYYAFFVFFELQGIDPSREEFTLSELINNGFSRIFGWDNGQMREVLELIEREGLVILNKQFDDYHIRMNASIDDLVSILN